MEGIAVREDNRGFLFYINELDKMSNHMMKDKLSKLDVWLYLRIASHCWSKKSVCTKTVTNFAAESGKSKHSIKASIRRLADLKFITVLYRIQYKGAVKVFKNYAALEEFQEKYSGKILSSHHKTHPKIKSFVTKEIKSKT